VTALLHTLLLLAAAGVSVWAWRGLRAMLLNGGDA